MGNGSGRGHPKLGQEALACLAGGAEVLCGEVGGQAACDGEVVGEGWHEEFGGPHAEVNAINALADKSILSESTVYVTLEPCSHFGKTPPCADLLIEHKIKKLVIANLDSNPLVSGNGVKKLREAVIEVVTVILAREVR